MTITTEEAEALAEKLRHTLAVAAFDETRRAAEALLALATERDQLRDRAERAESEVERLRGVIDRIDELNTTEPDEDGNQWAVSDLIHQEIVTARGGLRDGDNADQQTG